MIDSVKNHILTMKKSEIESLPNKKQTMLFESCPCCKGIGVTYAIRKGKSLKIWCSYRGVIYEEKRYYE